MSLKKAPEATVTKTGATVTTCYCRKCMENKSHTDFYDAVDNGLVDSNGKFSVCKDCTQKLYDEIFVQTNSLEKTIHKLCIILNVRFSNEALSAMKTHTQTLIDNGKKVNAVFSIYKMKLVSVNPSMDKSVTSDMGYEDVGAIFTAKEGDGIIPIPQELIDFWGIDVEKEDIEFLEKEYANFKQTHSADTYAQIVLLKQVCYTLLDIKKLRKANDDTDEATKTLQAMMKTLAISPNATTTTQGDKGTESLGIWIQDIERYEPAQWLKNDPRGDIYRDVANVDEYFKNYISRPIKNFILSSKDFNISDEDKDGDDSNLPASDGDFQFIDDGDSEG
jgi:hypothetical protein